jgi:hypothetical protein
LFSDHKSKHSASENSSWKNLGRFLTKILNLQQMNANMSENKLNKHILSDLQSSDSLKVIDTIRELRDSGNASYIPVLMELMLMTENPEIKSRIISLLADLKQSDAIPLIIDAIQDKKYAPELKSLVSVCWENGLDFSNYLSLFVDLIIEQEFVVAFEAYTVIQNMTGKVTPEVLDQVTIRIREALLNSDEQRRALLQDTLDFLPELS